MNETKITRKQFLQAFAAAPALGLIGKGGSFYEIDYEDGVVANRWIDNYGREVWFLTGIMGILGGNVAIVNGDYAFIYQEGDSVWYHRKTMPKKEFHIFMGVKNLEDTPWVQKTKSRNTRDGGIYRICPRLKQCQFKPYKGIYKDGKRVRRCAREEEGHTCYGYPIAWSEPGFEP